MNLTFRQKNKDIQRFGFFDLLSLHQWHFSFLIFNNLITESRVGQGSNTKHCLL